MQEKFVLKTVKRIAAISTGVAMLGATLTGALAAPQLKDYPSPFVKSGVYDDANAFVTGDNALAADTLGLLDISTNLQFLAKTPVSTGGQTVSVTGGQTKTVPLGQTLSNTSDLFDAQMDKGDVSTLFKGKFSFKGTDYDAEEQLQFRKTGANNEPTVATSLSSSDDDYKSEIALEFQRDTIYYAYRFVDAITEANMGNVSTTNKMRLNLLGTPMRITKFDTDTSLTAQVGEEHFLLEGDSVTLDGKVVKLEAVGSTNAVVSVDGESKVVEKGDSQVVNGVEVTVDSVISKTNKGDSSAVLVVGKDSQETYNDGDAFAGEDKDSPKWVWDLRNLLSDSSTDYADFGGASDVKVLRVENDVHYEDDSDKPPKVGSCVALPNDYLQICLDSFTVSDDNYKELEMKYESSTDLSDVRAGNTSVPAVRIWFPVDDGLLLPAYTTGGTGAGVSRAYYRTNAANETASVKTKEVFLYTSNALSGEGMLLDVYYRDYSATPNKVKFHGSILLNVTTADGGAQEVLELNYDNTKAANMVLEVERANSSSGGDTTAQVNLSWDINGDTTNDLFNASDDLRTRWGLSSTGKFNSLGSTASTEESTELVWRPDPSYGTTLAMGTKDEDHRGLYGHKIQNPKSSASSDKVKLQIPNDQVKLNVVVKGKSSTVTSGGTSYVPAKVTPRSLLASEVTDPTQYNLLVVGGPCANPLAETLFAVTCEGWPLQEGEAMLKLADNGNKVALLVAGTGATDTRRAAKALASSETYLKNTAKSEAVVKGATLNDINVE